MSRVTVLQPTQTEGEYQASEWQEYDGDLNHYLGECFAHSDIGVSPSHEAPVVYNGGGVTLRIWHKYTNAEKAAGANGDGWYTYEQFEEGD